MTSLPDWLLPLLGGNTIISAALGYFVPAMVTRKKDAGELATDLLSQALERIDKLEADSARCQQQTGELRVIITRNDLVIRLVVPELQRVAPYSTSLLQARDLLGAAFPVSADVPDDMAATLRTID